MASTKEYYEFIADMLSGIDGISFRKMMGEYIVYCRGKTVGGIYDDRFLVKPTKSARDLMPDAAEEIPYDGAKKMLLVDNVDDRAGDIPVVYCNGVAKRFFCHHFAV